MKIVLKSSFKDLGKEFSRHETPAKFSNPKLIKFNEKLANSLNIKSISGESTLAQVFSGQKILNESSMISMAYAGHQFGHFVPSLGDGRAMLIGEVIDEFQTLYDVQLKGAGPTNFSRGGDGFSSLGPVIREYILSEAMFNLGVKTTRALAAVETGDEVYREYALPGGVFTRVARSHLRVGTLQYFAAREETESLRTLVDYTIKRLYPHLKEHPKKYENFFVECAKSLIDLVNHWLSIGFIHGVMNTDNTSLSGETIDYGPCAFMDRFEANKKYSFIDKGGRYRYSNQIQIIFWNISRLAETLIELIPGETEHTIDLLTTKINALQVYARENYIRRMCKKFGILKPGEEHFPLIKEFLDLLEANNLDFTNSFRSLCDEQEKCPEVLKPFKEKIEIMNENQIRESIALMRSSNPIYIPRNHLVEKAISEAIENDSYDFFHRLNEVYEKPYLRQEGTEDLTRPPEASEVVQNTFCGT